MISYGIVDLCDADSGILLHKQVIYKLNGEQVYLYRSPNLNEFDKKIFIMFTTTASPVDVNFFFNISLRALIDIITFYNPELYREIYSSTVCDRAKISMLETAFSNKILHKLLKKPLHQKLIGKQFLTVKEEGIGAELLSVEKIKGFCPKKYIICKNEKEDKWNLITFINIETDYDITKSNIKILEDEIYRYYHKNNFEKKYKHFFFYKKNYIIVHSQCDMRWFNPPKQRTSLIKEFR